MRYLFFFLYICCAKAIFAQPVNPRVLFLGNSYTAANNLPQLLFDVAKSTGDSMYFESNTPGGYTLYGHSTNITSLDKISQGNWDFVVLQEQSQLPSFTDHEVDSLVFPYAHKLDSLICSQNPCAETVFYMTWGRKNGDATNCAIWPPVCTYQGMDSLLNLRYRIMADSNNAILSPVGAVWHYLRDNNPAIELYSADESHPSIAGSYAAACCFYTSIFRKDPTFITYDGGLVSSDAVIIRNAVKAVVFENLSDWHIGEYDPVADIDYVASQNEISFTNLSVNSEDYFWDFGDGTTSALSNPEHVYNTTGLYTVSLVACHCSYCDTTETEINIVSTSEFVLAESKNRIIVYPNPAKTELFVLSELHGQTYYRIINTTGNEMMSGILNDKINIDQLPAGVYYFLTEENKSVFRNTLFVKFE